jgi:hypothetical protein
MRTFSLAIVFAILAWTVSLNIAHAQCAAYETTMQGLRARYDQQEQLYNRAIAQASAARTPELARIYAAQADAAVAEANRILDLKTVIVVECSRP